jgi:tRNA nucleotidyltransferase (CCA-adding enzyme)
MLNKKISPNLINPAAMQVCQKLNHAGFQAYIVGDCVRDLLLGITPKDWSLTTDASPNQIIKLFEKTIPTGIKHGTITVLIAGSRLEVTTFRIDGNYKNSRFPEQVFFVQRIEQDLGRRDFTINAIAYDPLTNHLVDPFQGIEDLDRKIIKCVGNPNARFSEDALRILRAVSLSAKLKFEIDLDTFLSMQYMKNNLLSLSLERINQELTKLLVSTTPSIGLHCLLEAQILSFISPLLSEDKIFHVNKHIDQCSGNLETKLALLFHHDTNSKVYTELVRLKFSNKQIKKTMFILNLLENFHKLSKSPSKSSYLSFIAIIKNHSIDTYEETLNQFLKLTSALNISTTLLSQYSSIVLSKKEMLINGDDLINIGLPPGAIIKKLLDMCYLEILKNPEHNNKDYLLSWSSKYFNEKK